jgi:cytochrome c-type biogenesis protein CcmH
VKALVAVVAFLAFASGALASEQRPTLPELESEVMCPTCRTPLDQSSAPAADQIRAFIRARIAAGDTKSQIKAALVADFGPEILTEPPRKGVDLLVWVLPLAGLALGAAVLGALAWRWSRSPDEGAPAAAGRSPLEPELERRLDEELARFDP